MIVENPEITLDIEGHGFPQEALPTAMMDWTFVTSVYGDDGQQYWIECALMLTRESWGHKDMWIMGICQEKGKVVQSPQSIYRIADFPKGLKSDWHIYPHGSLALKRSKRKVTVDLGDFHVICRDDKTWHCVIDDKEKGVKAEWVHTGVGFPLWYGKEKPQVYTPHSIAYGYRWTGTIEGMLTIGERKVNIKGAGFRERYYAVDACPAEVGGWHDDVWFHFNEMFGNLDEMKLTRHKDMALYLVDEKQFFPSGSFNIVHQDWAYLRPLGTFIPTRYMVTVEVEAGVLEMEANVAGYHMWGTTGEVPDSPTVTLHWDKLNGTFTRRDGRKRTLTNGLGGSTPRLWKPYPNILTPGFPGTDTLDVTHLATI